MIAYALRSAPEAIVNFGNGLIKGEKKAIADYGDRLSQFEKSLKQYDPTRALNLGYSLVRLGNGKMLRASTDTKVGDKLDIRLSKGRLTAGVDGVYEN
jgi:exonuclease VII large subunit